MVRTANVNDTVADDEDDASEKVVKKTINAGVSKEFRNAVEAKARELGYTMSTYVAYLIRKATGVAADMPEPDEEQEKWLITTSVEEPVADAFKALIPNAKAQFGAASNQGSDLLRKIVADDIGYDLSKEPVIVRGQWAGQIKEKLAEAQTTQSKMFTRLYGMVEGGVMEKEVFESMLADANKTYEDFNLAPLS